VTSKHRFEKSICVNFWLFSKQKAPTEKFTWYTLRRIHAVSVSDDSTYFHNHVNEMLNALGLGQLRSEDLVDIIDGYKGAGYGRSTQEDHGTNVYYATLSAISGIDVSFRNQKI